jgi:hypothetical protein
MLLACDPNQRHVLNAESTRSLLLGDVGCTIDIVRIKDRFWNPTSGGWSDTMINFRFTDDPTQHVAEIQLCHSRMMTVRREQGAHHGYNQFRSALELLEAIGKPPVDSSDRRPDPVSRTTSGNSILGTPQTSVGGHTIDILEQALDNQSVRLDEEVAARQALEALLSNALDRISRLEKSMASIGQKTELAK